MTRPWMPLLTGELADRARNVVDDIATALRAPEPGPPSLSTGSLGSALFFRYLGDDGAAEAHRDRAVDAVATTPMSAGLYGGLAGMAWVVEHLGDDDDDDDDTSDAAAEVDEVLFDLLAETPWRSDYELIHGLTGIGVYALERARRPVARAVLGRVVVRLAELAEPRGDGVAWRTCPEHLPDSLRARYPRGYFNLGAAHGAPAAALVLAGASAIGIEIETARTVLDGAMRWMLGRERFTCWESEDGPAMPARTAWCYGEPGIAASLAATARAVGEPSWARAARTIAQRAAATRAPDETGVVDASLCHGAAGLGVLFHRLWHATGDDVLAEAARGWYARTLALHRPGVGVGGYQAWLPAIAPAVHGSWEDERSFLIGSSGVGLALLAGLGVEPRWDRLLAASLPRWATP